MTNLVFIVDNDASVRRSLARLLRSEGIDSESFESATAYLSREPYDGVGCILLDINMPNMSGIELQARLEDRKNDIPVIFLTGHGNVSNSVTAMKRGAMDFLTQPVDKADLLRAVHSALDHHRRVLEASRSRDSVLSRIESLTPREHEVMLELITGAPNKIVADTLQIAVKTVKIHRANVMNKMGVRSVAELLQLCHVADIEPDPTR